MNPDPKHCVIRCCMTFRNVHISLLACGLRLVGIAYSIMNYPGYVHLVSIHNQNYIWKSDNSHLTFNTLLYDIPACPHLSCRKFPCCEGVSPSNDNDCRRSATTICLCEIKYSRNMQSIAPLI